MTFCPGCGVDHAEKHPQVHIEYGSQSAEVDEMLAPLILEMWKHDIFTIYSCQDDGDSMEDPKKKGLSSIQMFPEDLVKFLDLIKIETKDVGMPEDPFRPFPFTQWDWEMYPSRGVFNGEWTTKLMVSAVFPQKHIPLIVELLKRHDLPVYTPAAH